MIMQKKTSQKDDLIEDKKHLQLASEKLNVHLVINKDRLSHRDN